MKKRSELIFSLLLVPVDYLMMIVGFVLAYFIREGSDKPFSRALDGQTYLHYLLILLPVWIIIFAALGLYSLESTRRRVDEVLKVLIASACGVMVLIVLDFINPGPVFPAKSIPVYGFAFTVLFIVLARLIVSTVQRILFRKGIGVHQTLVLAPQRVVRDLKSSLGPGYSIVNERFNGDLRRPNVDEIRTYVSQNPLDEVIHAYSGGEKDVGLVAFCQNHHIAYRFIPNIMGLYNANVQTALYGGVPVLELQQTTLEGWGRILKRAVDLLVALAAIIVLSPFFVVLAIIIKLTDPGTVFYAHERLSRTGRRIRVYKFRSMKMAYSTGGKFASKTTEEALAKFDDPALLEEFKKYQKVKNDPRVSWIGKLIRKTSIDELAQLLNVLKGDLSLVGPRPIIEEELERYGELGGKFLAIKPGMTGLWQVSGRNDIDYQERIRLDIYYVENWSLWLDVTILWRTLGVVLRGRGY